jgi:hypothetical protein
MSHTPGPWRVVRHNADRPGLGWLLEANPNIIIGLVHDSVQEIDPYTHIPIRSEQSDANARLIAAAPDLLAELERIVRALEPQEETGLDLPGIATLNAARAAIKKATGL